MKGQKKDKSKVTILTDNLTYQVTKFLYWGSIVSLVLILLASMRHVQEFYLSVESKDIREGDVVAFAPWAQAIGMEVALVIAAYVLALKRRRKETQEFLYKFGVWALIFLNFVGNMYAAMVAHKELSLVQDIFQDDRFHLLLLFLASGTIPLFSLMLLEYISFFFVQIKADEAQKKAKEAQERKAEEKLRLKEERKRLKEEREQRKEEIKLQEREQRLSKKEDHVSGESTVIEARVQKPIVTQPTPPLEDINNSEKKTVDGATGNATVNLKKLKEELSEQVETPINQVIVEEVSSVDTGKIIKRRGRPKVKVETPIETPEELPTEEFNSPLSDVQYSTFTPPLPSLPKEDLEYVKLTEDGSPKEEDTPVLKRKQPVDLKPVVEEFDPFGDNDRPRIPIKE